MKEALEKYMNATLIPDEVYDNIFNIQDTISETLRPKLKKIQKYEEVEIHPDDEFESTVDISERPAHFNRAGIF